MIVLGIDTSGYANAVGLVDNGQVLADHVYEARTDSLERIVANIDEVLKSTGKTLDDVRGIAVGLGPGSWTGIRVGVTVGKMLAFSLGTPVAGITTFDALAAEVGNYGTPVCAIINAGTRDTVYAAFYRCEGGGIVRNGEDFIGSIRDLAKKINEKIILAGPEAGKYVDIIRSDIGENSEIKAVQVVPRGATIASLAAERFLKADSDDVLSLSPLYLKESSAKSLAERRGLTKRHDPGGHQ